MRKNNKITDAGKVPAGSRGDQSAEAINFYKKLRQPQPLVSVILLGEAPPDEIINKYNLKGIEFGRWVNFNDRLDYLKTTVIAFSDLQSILRFNHSNIGFDKLTFAIGARGASAASAHFEPHSDTINITRFHRKITDLFGNKINVSKFKLVEITGGISSVAHEYGHYLDYFFGSYIEQEKESRSLSGGHSTRTTPETLHHGALRNQMEAVINSIVWETMPNGKSKGVKTIEYQKMYKFCYPKKIYWLRRNELFARAFEVYIYEKLKKQGITNKALTHDQGQYTAWPYIKGKTRIRVIKEIDILLRQMREIVNK
jgi:hypothetical protein